LAERGKTEQASRESMRAEFTAQRQLRRHDPLDRMAALTASSRHRYSWVSSRSGSIESCLRGWRLMPGTKPASSKLFEPISSTVASVASVILD
jgi:hypothetical protein